MKLASYIADGRPGFGVVSDTGVVTMNDRLQGRFATLKDALAANALGEIRRAAHGVRPDHELKNIEFLPVISEALMKSRTLPSLAQV